MPGDLRTHPATRRARAAVAALFVVNGATYNSLVPRFPELRDGIGLSNTELGLAIVGFPAAALALGILAGPLIARAGSARVAVLAGVTGALLLPLTAAAESWSLLALTLFALGVTDAWTDAAMNAHGLRVQLRYGRSIINGLHASWSMAAVGAGFLGAVAAGLGVPLWAHLSAVAVVLVVVSLVARRFLLDGPESAESDRDGTAEGAGLRGTLTSWPTVVPLLGIAALMVCAGAIEDTAASWGAVYLTDDLAASPFVAGLPFVAFQIAMTVGRLVGDRVVDRLGAVRVVRGGGVLAAVGLGGALLVAHPAAAVVGWAITGIGVATVFPLAFGAAGAVPGVRRGDGVAVVGWLARLGFLVFPPTIGVLADRFSVAVGLALVPVAALGVALVARAVRTRS